MELVRPSFFVVAVEVLVTMLECGAKACTDNSDDAVMVIVIGANRVVIVDENFIIYYISFVTVLCFYFF